jgi:hypothetical protein
MCSVQIFILSATTLSTMTIEFYTHARTHARTHTQVLVFFLFLHKDWAFEAHSLVQKLPESFQLLLGFPVSRLPLRTNVSLKEPSLLRICPQSSPISFLIYVTIWTVRFRSVIPSLCNVSHSIYCPQPSKKWRVWRLSSETNHNRTDKLYSNLTSDSSICVAR